MSIIRVYMCVIRCLTRSQVNSTIAIAAEALKKAGVYDPKRFAMQTIDLKFT